MADESRITFDCYADQFTITMSPFGANLSFAVQEPLPSVGRSPQAQRLGTIRMSIEHLKTMVMIMRRQVLTFEDETGVRVEVPKELLRQLNIAGEDWDAFWRYGG